MSYNLSFLQPRQYPTRVRISPKMLTFDTEAGRNFYEFPDDKLEERNGTNILQRTGDIEEENETSPVCYSGPGGGFSICEFHTNRFDPQDESNELSEDSKEETAAGTSYEGDVGIEEDIVLPKPVR